MGNRERYVLDVSTKGITIKGTTAAAVYHGVMTLWQILLGDVSHTKRGEIACIHIDDTPRFGYRALMPTPHAIFCPERREILHRPDDTLQIQRASDSSHRQ